MNQENPSQRSLTRDEINALEWRIRSMLEKGETAEEVERQLVASGLTAESAKLFVEEILKAEKEGKKDRRASRVGQFVAMPIIIIGFLLALGNITGLFPTFPYSGFVVIILGAVIGGIVGAIAAKTVR